MNEHGNGNEDGRGGSRNKHDGGRSLVFNSYTSGVVGKEEKSIHDCQS